MKFKRALSGITALVCCAGLGVELSLAQPSVSVSAAVVTNDFERSYEGWYGNADAVSLTALDGIGYQNTRGMLVANRQTPLDGASAAKGLYLSGGVRYTYSMQVYSETAQKFHMTLTCVDPETGEETIKELATKAVPAGEWTEISAQYTAPKNSIEFVVDIRNDATTDFRFDNVNVTQKQKQNTNTATAASADQGLKNAFGSYFRVGSVLNGGTVNNSGITANIIKDNNSVTCENETKPDATLVQSQCSGTNIGVSLRSAASIMDFCSKNGIGMRGHTLVWHSQTPEWFFKEGFNASGAWVSKSVMNQRMESYIKNMFNAIKTQYPDLDLYAYDVANECVSDDSNRTKNNGGARVPGYGDGKSPWVQVYGDNSFVEQAFTYARKYAPADCKLFYNDYNEYWDHKRDCIATMCASLYKKGVLDGIGMQSHINAQYDGFSGVSAYTTALQKFAAIGCEVQITELDISIEAGKFTLQQQSDKYKAIFQAAMNQNTSGSGGKVTAVCIWGPNDANTWIKTENAPLLYDTNNQPKLAYNTLMKLIPESEWNQTTGNEPDENGWYFHSTFEGKTDSWSGRGAATVMTSGRTAYAGSESLLIQEREAAWNGATYALGARTFVPGNEYSFSSNVMYFDGGATEPVYMKLQYTDASGETNYSTIAEATAIQGEWVQLANTNYQIPSDATDMQLYVETADGTMNFYVDEAIGAVAGTVIAGAGAKKLTLGDVNCDGFINALDLSDAKRGFMGSFDSSIAKLAADVDQSGKVDATDIGLLRDWILRKISEFPVAERVVDVEAMETLFAGVTPTAGYKKEGENNALYTQRFGADPGFLVYKDRLYVYTTNDAFEYDSNGKMQENTYNVQTINCISSSDLVNWTDHGAIPAAGSNGAAKWAYASWAPDACWKTINGKDKFFLYFANSAGGIGVLTADSPEGPWTDPIGHALVTKQTANCSDVEWMFDPAVMVDDDGTGYLYFGGGVPDGKAADPGTARAVKLGADMTSISGTPVRLNPPYLFEDSSILKIGSTYYYSFCTNFSTAGNNMGIGSGEIGYMTSSSPLGPFTYQGIMFKNPATYGLDKGGNNHHSLVKFKDQYYLLYHARAVENRMGIALNYRSPHLDVANISNGKVSVTGTMKGVSQVETLNPYQTVQAETMSNQAGTNVKGLGNTIVTDISKGDWIKVAGAAFTDGASSLTVRVSSKSGGAIKVCTGTTSGTAIGYVEVPATGGSFQEITVPVNNVTGTKDICFLFSGEMELDSWSFAK